MAQDERITGKTRTFEESELANDPNDQPQQKQMRQEKSGNEEGENKNENENENENENRFSYEISLANTQTSTLTRQAELPKARYIYIGDNDTIGYLESQIEMKNGAEMEDFDVDDKSSILTECTSLKQVMNLSHYDFADLPITISFVRNAEGAAGYMIGNDVNKQLLFELALVCSTTEEISVPHGKIVALKSARPGHWANGTQYTHASFDMSFSTPSGLLCFLASLLSDWTAVNGNDEFVTIKNGGPRGTRQRCIEISVAGKPVPFSPF